MDSFTRPSFWATAGALEEEMEEMFYNKHEPAVQRILP